MHVLTQKGRGYPPAEDDDEKHLHDAPVFDPAIGPPPAVATGYTQAFAEAIIKEAEADPRIVAITAAMPGPTGLLPFQARFPDRFFDVGIAEQHAVTGAAGMAMGGLRPVVAIYSTFLNRAWDQVVYDVALHRLPVVFCLDRAGITGPDGASHHGVYDMALLAKVPGMRVLAPSSAEELQRDAARRHRPGRRGPGRHPLARAARRATCASTRSASGLHARQVTQGDGSVCHPGRRQDGRRRAEGRRGAGRRRASTPRCGTCARAPRSIPTMIADAAAHGAVITAEDGIRDGGIGMTIADQVHAIDPTVPVHVLGIPSKFLPQGSAEQHPRPARARRRRHRHRGPQPARLNQERRQTIPNS